MAHDKNRHPFPIEPAPFAPGGECHPCCPPRPPRPTPPPPPGCGPSMYVGARYVPKFAEPIDWDTERGYESLTIVTYKGESYTSKCPVPPGIDIKNGRYWALTGAYNAQVEEYKNQVKDLSEQVTGFASDNKEFRDKITQYDKDNAEMKNSVASTVARVDALAERVDNADAAISDLQAGQSQVVTDIAALEAKDSDLQRQITSNDTDISALQAKDREQDARLSAIETVNDAQAATLSQNTQDIARNTENIQDNAANIAVNSKELAKHAAQLKDHTAQLSVLHTEVTDNHTAIERLTSVTDGLRADLTEDEAKIAQNADAIAHIQQKDVQQDGRLDALEGRATTAEGRLDALDDKTDATNTALTAETNRAKAAELANGELIAANAQELARHSDELSDHERRISALETDNNTNKQDIADIKAKNAAQDTAIAAVDDKVEHLELIDPQEYAATIQRIDAKDAEQDGKIAALETASADHVTRQEFTADQKRQDDIVGDITDISKTVTDGEGYTLNGFASIGAFFGDIMQAIADSHWFTATSMTNTNPFPLASILKSLANDIARVERDLRSYVQKSVYDTKISEIAATDTKQTQNIAANTAALETKVDIANDNDTAARYAAIGVYVKANDDTHTAGSGRCIRFLMGTNIAGAGSSMPANLKVYTVNGTEILATGVKHTVYMNGMRYGEIYLGSPIENPEPFYVVVANPATTT